MHKNIIRSLIKILQKNGFKLEQNNLHRHFWFV